MDLSEIKDSAPAFVDFVERFWNIDKNFTVKLISTQRPEPSFLLAISEEIGGRAFVQYSQKLIKFYNYNRLATIIHEFGHVFGLRDEYYMILGWDHLQLH